MSDEINAVNTESTEAPEAEREVVFEDWKAFYAPDPRYNFAPEDWYGTMDETTATGDLKALIDLKHQLDVTADTAARTEIALQMLQLHEANMWTLAYVEASPTYHAVNARIQNFLADGVWSDIYRDMGIAHCQCWYIAE